MKMANFDADLKEMEKDTVPKRIAAIELSRLLEWGRKGIVWAITGALVVEILFRVNIIIASIGFVVWCCPMLYGLIYIQRKLVHYKTTYNV
jgi:hypothetical protein